MTRKFNAVLATLLLALFTAFWLWQSPGLIQGKLSSTEVEGYIAQLKQYMAAPLESKQQFEADLRRWGAGDDGKPVYMVNLLRFNDGLRRWPGAPDFAATPTPEEANDFYEFGLAPLALRSGVYPIFNSVAQGSNLISHAPDVDNWDRVAVMRFPSRRSFFEWAADPTFGRLFAYKYAAVEIALVPTSADLLLPDLRLLLGLVLVIIYLLARRRRHV